MAELTANKFIELVRKSELIKEERLNRFLAETAEESGGRLPESNQAIAKRLISEGLLTPWQSEKLLAGRHRGFRLGKYKLLGQIGKGGMSSVYLAEHVLMRRRVAIKVLPRSRVSDRSYLERFQLEARAVARLDDPNIVRAFDIDNEGDTHYIVMEYVEGQDLHQIVAENGPLDYVTSADYITQACNGLQHAHEMGLIHRDIKPANLLVDKSQTVKLLDLGLAKIANDEETSLTLANEENVLGTADYLAPEQALNSHTADERADVYSMGCTLYYLLTGRPPFPEGTISERLLKHQVETPKPIIDFRPDAPLSLVDICERMMRKAADERPQSAGEVAHALTEWLADRGRKPHGGEVHGYEEESGVGSGILSRLPARPPSSGSVGGLSGAGSKPPSSGGLPSALRDTTRLNGPDTTPVDEENLELAPLEDLEEPKPKKRPSGSQTNKPSSGVLDESPGSSGSTKSKSKGPGSSKRQSIFEEEFADRESEEQARRKALERQQYDPLHPPGYRAPSSGLGPLAWAAIGGVGLLILVLVIVFVAL